MLSDALREVLAAYWRWKRPTEWFFPGAKPGRPIYPRSRFRYLQKGGEAGRHR